jgi:hypothetical protein
VSRRDIGKMVNVMRSAIVKVCSFLLRRGDNKLSFFAVQVFSTKHSLTLPGPVLSYVEQVLTEVRYTTSFQTPFSAC